MLSIPDVRNARSSACAKHLFRWITSGYIVSSSLFEKKETDYIKILLLVGQTKTGRYPKLALILFRQAGISAPFLVPDPSIKSRKKCQH
jgi:hypothetical protein